MGWFSKRPKPLVPRKLLEQLGPYGRAAWEAKINGQAVSDPRFDWTNFLSGFLPAYQKDFDRMVAEIHAAAGDDPFARYGGYRVITEFEADSVNPLYLQLMDVGLGMMFDRGMSSGSLTGFEAQRWIARHGDLRTSFDRIEDIDVSQARSGGPDLAGGEELMVARMGPRDLDNQFWIERLPTGTFRVFSMRQWESDSVTLTRCEEQTLPSSGSVEDVLRGLGEHLRMEPYWAHEQLVPYFPERRGR